jgi:hypothetical protein
LCREDDWFMIEEGGWVCGQCELDGRRVGGGLAGGACVGSLGAGRVTTLHPQLIIMSQPELGSTFFFVPLGRPLRAHVRNTPAAAWPYIARGSFFFVGGPAALHGSFHSSCHNTLLLISVVIVRRQGQQGTQPLEARRSQRAHCLAGWQQAGTCVHLRGGARGL